MELSEKGNVESVAKKPVSTINGLPDNISLAEGLASPLLRDRCALVCAILLKYLPASFFEPNPARRTLLKHCDDR
jgi:hypothetical protein